MKNKVIKGEDTAAGISQSSPLLSEAEMEREEKSLKAASHLYVAAKKAKEMHLRGGDCFNLVEMMLSAYRNMRYNELENCMKFDFKNLKMIKEEDNDKIIPKVEFITRDHKNKNLLVGDIFDLLDASEFATRVCKSAIIQFSKSNKIQLETVICFIIEQTLSILEKSPNHKKQEEAAVLRARYLNPNTKDVESDEEIIEYMHFDFKKSKFSALKVQGITEMSQILFGATAANVSSSPFYTGKSFISINVFGEELDDLEEK